MLRYLIDCHHLPENVVHDLTQGLSITEVLLYCMTMPVWPSNPHGYRQERTLEEEHRMRVYQLSYLRSFWRCVRRLRNQVNSEGPSKKTSRNVPNS